MNKKSKLSITIRVTTLLLLIVMPLLALSPELFGYTFPDPIKLNLIQGQLPIDSVSLKTRLIILFIAGLHYTILVIGLFAVAKIFDMFVNEHWFLPDFSKHLKTFGISLIVFTLTSGITKVLIAITIGFEIFNNLDKYNLDNMNFKFMPDVDGLLIILIGILLILVARVLSKANRNAQDLEQIV